ncbi:hypothetical protein MY3296_007327 [Beauveria thailandica]
MALWEMENRRERIPFRSVEAFSANERLGNLHKLELKRTPSQPAAYQIFDKTPR